MAVADLDRPGSLGRVIAAPAAGAAGDRPGERLAGIVEAADAGPAELAIPTVNAGFYALPAPEIFAYLARLAPQNAQGELYLTDAVVAAAGDGRRVALHRLADPEEALGVNTPEELDRAERALLARTGGGRGKLAARHPVFG
jgi:bifunctional N-acetylglucosamine-1-phosphate-uridyltransferase/glucosamine-1-phosphate-acetyltransferase GlmU-like protein